MHFIYKIPGYLLLLFGGFCLSWGGLIIRYFEEADVWGILLLRSSFFLIALIIFLFFTYKRNTLKIITDSGFSAILGGFFLSLSFIAYTFGITNTSVANVVFIISTQTMFLAIFGYFFLKEKISKLTLFCICLAISGILLMLGTSISPGQMTGNLVAFIMPISFAILILIVRKFPEVDMIPLQLVAGIFAMIIGLLLSPTIIVSPKDIFLGFLAGFFQVGFGFIFITIGARSTPAAFVGIIMLTEAVLGPFWAWMFVNENLPLTVLIGGSIVITAVVIQFFDKFIKEKKTL